MAGCLSKISYRGKRNIHLRVREPLQIRPQHVPGVDTGRKRSGRATPEVSSVARPRLTPGGVREDSRPHHPTPVVIDQFPRCDRSISIFFSSSALRASRLKLAPFCMGGYSRNVCAYDAISWFTNTKRQNS